VNDNPQPGSPEPTRRVLLEALAVERLRIVATLIRTTGDWDLAEDAVADATERALHRWSLDGIPDNPAAWLTTTARRRAIDLLRRAATERNKLAELAGIAELREDPKPVTDMTFLHDDRLRLIFTCAHPALPMEGRVALTLKVVAGLSTEAIAQAFLTTEATMGQRLLRAKRKITHAGIPYHVPAASALPERLDGVLAVVYLIFTSGYSRSASDVTEEAIRLGRLLVDLMPDNDETRGLLRLMLLQHARRHARMVGGPGHPRRPGSVPVGLVHDRRSAHYHPAARPPPRPLPGASRPGGGPRHRPQRRRHRLAKASDSTTNCCNCCRPRSSR
jgi:RNA polymerase sigma-70 factor, ECF subfamily